MTCQKHNTLRDSTHKKYINCNLFALVLKVVDISSRNTLCGISQDPFHTIRRQFESIGRVSTLHTSQCTLPGSGKACI